MIKKHSRVVVVSVCASEEGAEGTSGLLYLKEVLCEFGHTIKSVFHECHWPTNGSCFMYAKAYWL
jgi:Zn-dependent oligopeptidase